MIIVDTSFLSSLLKIGKLSLIFKGLDTKNIVITKGVLHELEQAPVHNAFLRALQSEENKIIIQSVGEVNVGDLGRGEAESITLAKKTSSLLLIDDRKAAQFAKEQGIITISIPSFLLLCKERKILLSGQIEEVIGELKEKDYYEFSDQVKQTLLK